MSLSQCSQRQQYLKIAAAGVVVFYQDASFLFFQNLPCKIKTYPCAFCFFGLDSAVKALVNFMLFFFQDSRAFVHDLYKDMICKFLDLYDDPGFFRSIFNRIIQNICNRFCCPAGVVKDGDLGKRKA